MELLAHDAENVTIRFTAEEVDIINFVLTEAHKMDPFIRNVEMDEVEEIRKIAASSLEKKQFEIHMSQRAWANIYSVMSACTACPSDRERTRIEEVDKTLSTIRTTFKESSKSVPSLLERLAKSEGSYKKWTGIAINIPRAGFQATRSMTSKSEPAAR